MNREREKPPLLDDLFIIQPTAANIFCNGTFSCRPAIWNLSATTSHPSIWMSVYLWVIHPMSMINCSAANLLGLWNKSVAMEEKCWQLGSNNSAATMLLQRWRILSIEKATLWLMCKVVGVTNSSRVWFSLSLCWVSCGYTVRLLRSLCTRS